MAESTGAPLLTPAGDSAFGGHSLSRVHGKGRFGNGRFAKRFFDKIKIVVAWAPGPAGAPHHETLPLGCKFGVPETVVLRLQRLGDTSVEVLSFGDVTSCADG